MSQYAQCSFVFPDSEQSEAGFEGGREGGREREEGQPMSCGGKGGAGRLLSCAELICICYRAGG